MLIARMDLIIEMTKMSEMDEPLRGILGDPAPRSRPWTAVDDGDPVKSK